MALDFKSSAVLAVPLVGLGRWDLTPVTVFAVRINFDPRYWSGTAQERGSDC
jgi:hypothetical protein